MFPQMKTDLSGRLWTTIRMERRECQKLSTPLRNRESFRVSNTILSPISHTPVPDIMTRTSGNSYLKIQYLLTLESMSEHRPHLRTPSSKMRTHTVRITKSRIRIRKESL